MATSCRASAFKGVNGLLAATRAPKRGFVYRLMGRIRLERDLEPFANEVEPGDFDHAMRTLDRISQESRYELAWSV